MFYQFSRIFFILFLVPTLCFGELLAPTNVFNFPTMNCQIPITLGMQNCMNAITAAGFSSTSYTFDCRGTCSPKTNTPVQMVQTPPCIYSSAAACGNYCATLGQTMKDFNQAACSCNCMVSEVPKCNLPNFYLACSQGDFSTSCNRGDNLECRIPEGVTTVPVRLQATPSTRDSYFVLDVKGCSANRLPCGR